MLGVIGGSGLESPDKLALAGLEQLEYLSVETPFADQAVTLYKLRWQGLAFLFLPRHRVDQSADASVAPHRINYRANIWALRQQGCLDVLAVAAVGGIREDCSPQRIVIPDQIIDYTWGREHSFVGSASDLSQLQYINFCEPYHALLRHELLQACEALNADRPIEAVTPACYGATQGPRLETAAEIRRLQKDGCDIVGMTGMPEAALAMEAGLRYATIALVVNWAAGIQQQEPSLDEIYQHLEQGMQSVSVILAEFIRRRC